MTVNPGSVPSPPDGLPGPQRSVESSTAGHLVHDREFLDFMGKLDQELRLPVGVVKPKPALSRAAKLSIAATLALALALGKGPIFSWWSVYEPTPHALLGAWSTKADRFQDRGFVVMGDSLQLHLGGARSVTYPIDGVHRGRRVDRNLFTVHYRDGNVKLKLALWMKTDSIAYIANLPGVMWRKESQ